MSREWDIILELEVEQEEKPLPVGACVCFGSDTELNSPTAPVEFDRMLEPPNFPWLPSSSSSSSPFPRKGHSRCILDAYPAILISSSIKLQPSPPF
jgi:hypothetical protein|uniref:Uncharacterized protein n=1 Tax=Oryza sativa subsp. japonica TaxID=39947 RepID=Q6K5X8_ORYSJ|nr:hypothetical protein [Oryza sativa Japonica Group]BAD19728.1 hypothetical protein [Oryza sativa Japonica Group]